MKWPARVMTSSTIVDVKPPLISTRRSSKLRKVRAARLCRHSRKRCRRTVRTMTETVGFNLSLFTGFRHRNDKFAVFLRDKILGRIGRTAVLIFFLNHNYELLRRFKVEA